MRVQPCTTTLAEGASLIYRAIPPTSAFAGNANGQPAAYAPYDYGWSSNAGEYLISRITGTDPVPVLGRFGDGTQRLTMKDVPAGMVELDVGFIPLDIIPADVANGEDPDAFLTLRVRSVPAVPPGGYPTNNNEPWTELASFALDDPGFLLGILPYDYLRGLVKACFDHAGGNIEMEAQTTGLQDNPSGGGEPERVGISDDTKVEAPADESIFTPQELAADPTVSAAIDQAWNDSNPNGPTADKVEQGFTVYYIHQTGELQTVATPRDPNAPSDSLPFPIDNSDNTKTLVGNFHTHPFTQGEGYVPEPSPADVDIANDLGVPGILRNHDGLEFFGPACSPEVPAPEEPD